MVPAEWNQIVSLPEADNKVQHTSGIRSAINVVTERDNRVVRPKPYEFNKGRQRADAAMDITDREMTGH
jgi:hypothetical protein